MIKARSIIDKRIQLLKNVQNITFSGLESLIFEDKTDISGYNDTVKGPSNSRAVEGWHTGY